MMAKRDRVRQCKTCRHWADVLDKARWRYWGECQKARSLDGYERSPGTLAVAVDKDEDWAALYTHEQFWCLQWEAKENAKA